MRNDLGDLVENLESQRDLYIRLLETGREKSAVIIRADSTALDQLVALEQELVQKAKLLDDKRMHLVAARAGDRHQSGAGFDDCARPGIPDREDACLIAVRSELRQVLHALDGINRTNRKLLENQLKLTRTILGHFTRPHSASAYGSDGNKCLYMNQSRNMYNQLL